MLHRYIDDDINNGYSNFIILGDWNDDLKDDDGEHVLQTVYVFSWLMLLSFPSNWLVRNNIPEQLINIYFN